MSDVKAHSGAGTTALRIVADVLIYHGHIRIQLILPGSRVAINLHPPGSARGFRQELFKLVLNK